MKVRDSKGIRYGDSSRMKIKNGWNDVEKKFYIQITDKKTLESLRINMERDHFINFARHILKTQEFSSPITDPLDPGHAQYRYPHSNLDEMK